MTDEHFHSVPCLFGTFNVPGRYYMLARNDMNIEQSPKVQTMGLLNNTIKCGKSFQMKYKWVTVHTKPRELLFSKKTHN